MNIREVFHAIAAVASAITAGSIVIPGSPDVAMYVGFVAALVALFLNTYLGSTTTGITKAVLATERATGLVAK